MTDISRRRLLGGSLAGGAAMLAGVAHAAEAEVPEKWDATYDVIGKPVRVWAPLTMGLPIRRILWLATSLLGLKATGISCGISWVALIAF